MIFESTPINILLVDDREENLISLENLLEQPGRNFFKATSGQEALKITLQQDIGLVLLDVQMPEMDGFEVASLLKSNPRTREIAIIFVTALNKEEQYMLKGFDEGAVDYLYKPLNVNVTRAKVQVFEDLYISQRQMRNYITQIERMNRKLDDFVHIVSHDIKAPLAGIASLLEFTQDDVVAGQLEEVKENLHLVSSQVNSLQDLVTGILQYTISTKTTTVTEKVKVAELLSELVKVLASGKNVTLHCEGNPVLHTDVFKIRQVFQNLLSNAIKYNDKPQCQLEVICQPKGSFLEFAVKDNGPGISPDKHRKIFELFGTDRRIDDRASTGIGLAIVKNIVEEEGGRIYVESEPGNGSSFIFTWPS